MKKKIVFICSVVILLSAFVIGLYCYKEWKNTQNNTGKDPFVELFVNNYPTDILVLGEELNLHDDLYVRHSETLNADVLKTKKGCVRQVIILSDRSGTVDFSPEELGLIREKMDALQCDFFCVGKSMDAKLVEAGILLTPQAEDTFIPSVYAAWGRKNYSNGFHDSAMPNIESVKVFILDEMKIELRDANS